MDRYSRDYMTAREEAAWVALRVKFYTMVVGGGVLTLGIAVTCIMLSIFLTPPAIIGILMCLMTGMLPFFGYSEYGQEFHTERIVRKREKEREQRTRQEREEITLEEAERIVAAFGKGK